MAKKVDVKESSAYENFVGKKDEAQKPSNLFDVLDIDDPNVDNEDVEWKKHWKGMPEFEQEENKTYKTIYVHFRNKEDYEEFAKLIDQNLSEKTKSIWHPALDREANSLLRWIEE
jgi:hypothetical protein